MAKKSNGFTVALGETLRANGKLLTVFAVASIIVGGITLVEYPQNWWIALLAVFGFFAILFLFLNARVVIKTVMASLITIVLAGVAFNLGVVAEPAGLGPFIWLFGHFIVFFFALSLSYFLPSGQSRWTTITLAVFSYFALTWALAILTSSIALPSALNIVISLGVFILMYLFGGQTRFSSKSMPEHVRSEELTERARLAAEHAGLNFRVLKSKEDTAFLVWGERAYVLYPIQLEQPLGFIGRKANRLGYKGKSVNAWLRYLSFTKNPYYKARGAETLLVLLDMGNKNGRDFKQIGVTVPDSKAVAPVGIMPGKLLTTDEPKALQKALANVDSQFNEFVTDLTEKQKDALSKFGVTKEKQSTQEVQQ